MVAGWRSWNSFHADINDTVMRAQMAAVTDTSRSVNGKPTSLAALGFDWVSMDDGWYVVYRVRVRGWDYGLERWLPMLCRGWPMEWCHWQSRRPTVREVQSFAVWIRAE